MYLASLLLSAEITLIKPQAEGPDLLLQLGRKVWIEAMATEPGTGVDAVRGREQRGYTMTSGPGVSTWYGHAPSDEETILRCTGAIRTKYEIRQRYIDKGIVNKSDPFVIAVNTGAIPDADLGGVMIPIILKATFGIGDEYLAVTQYSTSKPAPRHHQRSQILKKDGSPVASNLFTSDMYDGLSGVLFSSTSILNVPSERGRDITFVHNPRAKATLPLGTFRFGTEWYLGGDNCLHRDRHYQASDLHD